jgi:hypothetical protein
MDQERRYPSFTLGFFTLRILIRTYKTRVLNILNKNLSQNVGQQRRAPEDSELVTYFLDFSFPQRRCFGQSPDHFAAHLEKEYSLKLGIVSVNPIEMNPLQTQWSLKYLSSKFFPDETLLSRFEGHNGFGEPIPQNLNFRTFDEQMGSSFEDFKKLRIHYYQSGMISFSILFQTLIYIGTYRLHCI